MELKRLGVTVACENCQFDGCGALGMFDVSVPISDSHGVKGTAHLHCEVSTEGHSVEMVQWDGDGDSAELSPEALDSLGAALDVVADRRVCGNQHICPSEVVRVVAEVDNTALPEELAPTMLKRRSPIQQI